MPDFTADGLVEAGVLPPAVLAACTECLRGRRNVLVAGPTGVGKTTLLSALAALVPEGEGMLLIDACEQLRLEGPAVRRPGSHPGSVGPAFREAVRRALREGPEGERLVADGVDETVAADILGALGNGWGGSLVALQENGIETGLLRLASLASRDSAASGTVRPLQRVGAAIDLAVYLDRDRSGTRRVMHAARVSEGDCGWDLRSVWRGGELPPRRSPDGVPGFDTELFPPELERLAFLAEECAEAIQAVGKIVRHGYESYDPTKGRTPTNRRMLESELADIRFAISLLEQARDVSARNIEAAISARIANPGRYMHHQGRGNASGKPSRQGR